jgi:hypothetical protein
VTMGRNLLGDSDSSSRRTGRAHANCRALGLLVRVVLPAIVLAGIPQAAIAQAPIQAGALACGPVAALIASRGAAVLATSGTTYDRFVRDAGFCGLYETALPALVATREGPRCPVGYRCTSSRGR